MVRAQRRRKPFNFFWNLLTLFLVTAAVLIFTIELTIYVNPYAIFNPFPPVDMPEAIVLPTSTEVVSTATEVGLVQNTSVVVVIPTQTEMATSTPVVEIQDGTSVAETTPLPATETPFVGYYAFVAQNNGDAIPGSIFKPDSNCNWAGVAGQVFDLQGRPVKGIRIWLRGTYGSARIDLLSLTLESSPYGPSGFEFTLGEKPLNSQGKLYLQLLDQAGIPVSDRVYFDTFEDCEKNLILVNFKQVR